MILGFNDNDFLNINKIKIICGVAGCGKSSQVVDFLKSHGIDFLWTTSTNKLKRDAAERFGCEAKTVCSALFNNENAQFYKEEKDIAQSTVVIDEILQTSIKVLDWIANHVGKVNIIILTDTKQMLSAENGLSFIYKFEEFEKRSDFLLSEITETKRARDKATKDKIEELYTLSSDNFGQFVADTDANLFDIISYKDMEFNTHDIYITHLNETEDFLYKDKQFSTGSFMEDDLIPKGGISSRPPKNYTKYSIMSQLQAESSHARDYYQLKNVGTCTRYQGSECRDDQTLYYMITADSKITNREWYTVLSRCWKMSSIKIVICPRATKHNITEFNGKKIKKLATLSIIQ